MIYIIFSKVAYYNRNIENEIDLKSITARTTGYVSKMDSKHCSTTQQAVYRLKLLCNTDYKK